MSNIIKIKYSAETSNPADNTFQRGELGYSEADGYLYIGNTAGQSVKIGGAAMVAGIDISGHGLTELADVPDAYTGMGGRLLVVNAGATGIEFASALDGGSF